MAAQLLWVKDGMGYGKHLLKKKNPRSQTYMDSLTSSHPEGAPQESTQALLIQSQILHDSLILSSSMMLSSDLTGFLCLSLPPCQNLIFQMHLAKSQEYIS